MSGFAPDYHCARVRPSPNFGERREGLQPELLLMHYTGMPSGADAEAKLTDPAAEVSCHYLVHEDGEVVQMVREADRAWHAGKSFWRDVSDVNSWSIGIEVVNPGHGLGYPRFRARQMRSVIALCRDIVARHRIAAEMVLAHSDVAPGRKIDPGEKFPWRMLHEAGIGRWVRPSRVRRGPTVRIGDEGEVVADIQRGLAAYGYGVAVTGTYDDLTRKTVDAFQRHFRQGKVSGEADPSTRATLRKLLEP